MSFKYRAILILLLFAGRILIILFQILWFMFLILCFIPMLINKRTFEVMYDIINVHNLDLSLEDLQIAEQKRKIVEGLK